MPQASPVVTRGKLQQGEVEGGIVAADTFDFDIIEDMEQLKAIFRIPSLQIVSFTITEKGYALKNMNGEFFPFVLQCH